MISVSKINKIDNSKILLIPSLVFPCAYIWQYVVRLLLKIKDYFLFSILSTNKNPFSSDKNHSQEFFFNITLLHYFETDMEY